MKKGIFLQGYPKFVAFVIYRLVQAGKFRPEYITSWDYSFENGVARFSNPHTQEYVCVNVPNNYDTFDLYSRADIAREVELFKKYEKVKRRQAGFMGALGGASCSPAKQKASRQNGMLGGRPRKNI